MARVMMLRDALRVWILTILAAALLFLGGQLSDYLLRDHSAPIVTRWLAVAAAVLGAIPWIFTVGWYAAMGDEFFRRLVLMGTAIAFVADFLIHVAFGVMLDARLVGPDSYIPALPAAMGLWVGGVLVAAAYYRFAR